MTVRPSDIPSTNLFKLQSYHYVFLTAKVDGITKETKILLSSKPGNVFIQTDKPLYTPRQTGLQIQETISITKMY